MRSLRSCALVLMAVLFTPIDIARAETVTLFVTNAYTSVVADVVPAFEARTGHKVNVQNDASNPLLKRASAGEAFDVIVLTPSESIQTLADKGYVLPDSIRGLSKGSLAMAVRIGTPHPKIDTVEEFIQALLQAHKVAYSDPAIGGVSGVYLSKLFKRLNIEEKLSGNLLPRPGPGVAQSLLSGEAEVSVQQLSELMIPGVEIVGQLPDEIQLYSITSGAISANAKNPKAAQELMEAFVSKETKALLPGKGLSPME
ncbi:hypothetical protein FACS1894204_00370 [Synergistales bacterium]|nr:hypothetical protein FACS1894204_00370 [Synergistales bacterium]